MVGVYQEKDCTSTVIQLQSNDFYGHGLDSMFMLNGEKIHERHRRYFDRENYHQFQVTII